VSILRSLAVWPDSWNREVERQGEIARALGFDIL
jgi:hypothetical protein